MTLRITFKLGVCNCGCKFSIGNLRSKHGYLILYKQGHNGSNNTYANTMRKKEKWSRGYSWYE